MDGGGHGGGGFGVEVFASFSGVGDVVESGGDWAALVWVDIGCVRRGGGCYNSSGGS